MNAVVKAAGAYRTISEVATELDVPPHVLRFWESKFHRIQPLKRAGGRRYYRPQDVELLRRIRDLLHTEGYTIKGVQRIIDGEFAGDFDPLPSPLPEPNPEPIDSPPPDRLAEDDRETLRAVLEELYAMRRLLRGED